MRFITVMIRYVIAMIVMAITLTLGVLPLHWNRRRVIRALPSSNRSGGARMTHS
jgi:hypothetical protein